MKHGCIEKRLAAIGFRTRQKGASLLEGIAYLGIAAIVILGAISLLTNAFGNAQANKATEEVTALRTAVRKLYVGQTYPAAGIVGVLINASAVPSTLTVNTAASTIANAWGGGVTIVGASVAGTNSFGITYANVPKDACVNMLSGANGWVNIVANATTISTFPVGAGAASGACTSANANSVQFNAV